MTDQPKSSAGMPKPKIPMMTRHTLQPPTAPQRQQRGAPPAQQQPGQEPDEVEAEPQMSEDEYESWAAENPEEAQQLEEVVVQLAKGEISPAEAYGISVQDMAEAAVIGAEQLEAGNLESAVIIFEGLVTAEPKIPPFRVSLGQCYEKLGYNNEALDAYASALLLYALVGDSKLEDIMDAALLRANLLVREDREDEAIDELSRIVPDDLDLESAEPVMLQAYVLLMNLLEKAAKREEEANAAAAADAGTEVAAPAEGTDQQAAPAMPEEKPQA